MTEKEKLYETLGELLFAVAKADGVIQHEEKEALSKLLEKHDWASNIKWSFDYEESKDFSVDQVYKKVINFCHKHGPAPEYNEFIEAMTIIANAADGRHPKESDIINSFSVDLITRFQEDIDRIKEQS